MSGVEIIGVALGLSAAKGFGEEVGKGASKITDPIFGIISIPFELAENSLRELVGLKKSSEVGSFDWCVDRANQAVADYKNGKNTEGALAVFEALKRKTGFKIYPCSWIFMPQCPSGFPYFVGFDKNGQPVCLDKMNDKIKDKVPFVIEFACTSEAPYIGEDGDCHKCPQGQKEVFSSNGDFLGCNPCKPPNEFLGKTPSGNAICCPKGSSVSFDAFGNAVCSEPQKKEATPDIEKLIELLKEKKPENPCKIAGTKVVAYTADGRPICCPEGMVAVFDIYGNASCQFPERQTERSGVGTVISTPPPPPPKPMAPSGSEVKPKGEDLIFEEENEIAPKGICQAWEEFLGYSTDGRPHCRDKRPAQNPNYPAPRKLGQIPRVYFAKGENPMEDWNNQTLNERYWQDILKVLNGQLDVSELSPYATSFAHLDSGLNPSDLKSEIIRDFYGKFPKF